jgi:ABC-type multidrug transport system fused ATPase/permease subunit
MVGALEGKAMNAPAGTLSLAHPKRESLSTPLRTLMHFMRPYRWLLLHLFLWMVVVTACGLTGPLLVRDLVRVTRIGVEGNALSAAWQGILLIALALAVSFGLRSLGQFLTFHLSHVAAWKVCHDMRVALYRKLQSLSPAFYANRQTGELASRVLKDTDNIEPVVADNIHEGALSVMVMLGVIAVFIGLDARLTLVALLPLPLALVGVVVLTKRLIPAFDAESEHWGAFSGLVHDNLSGIREIQVFNREHHELARIHKDSNVVAEKQIHARKLAATLQPVIEGATGASMVLVVLFGGWQVLQGGLNVEDMVAFLLYVSVLYQPLWMLVGVTENFQRGLASLRRIGEVLVVQPDVSDPPNGVDLGRARGQITLEDVTFGYLPGMPVLQGVSVAVPPGETLALVGHTGAGKSTFASLVPRFYDPQHGRVLIDGVDARQVKLESLRRNISMVLQDVFLFNGSVRENIRFGNPDATDEQVIAAAKQANAHEFILALPNGYDTEVGERGVKLSGGQKQRLSIARAILKDAPILILDEATSAVDSETEAAIQEALGRLMRDRTSIVIAHRLSTVRDADQIAVMANGQVAELGKHDALMAHDGAYRRLSERQFAGVQPA